jgi:hypothetical protein
MEETDFLVKRHLPDEQIARWSGDRLLSIHGPFGAWFGPWAKTGERAIVRIAAAIPRIIGQLSIRPSIISLLLVYNSFITVEIQIL